MYHKVYYVNTFISTLKLSHYTHYDYEEQQINTIKSGFMYKLQKMKIPYSYCGV